MGKTKSQIDPQKKKKKKKNHSYNPPNKNGEHLAEFSTEKRLACLNKKGERKLLTNTYSNNTKA